MEEKLPVYQTKIFAGMDFKDYWNLAAHPLYFKLDKKEQPFIHVDEEYYEGATKTNSLQAIVNFLREHDWVIEKKYIGDITRYIQAAINMPFT
jgi:hypothetical protein